MKDLKYIEGLENIIEAASLEARKNSRIIAELICLLKDFAGGSYTESDMIRMSKEILANLEVGS